MVLQRTHVFCAHLYTKAVRKRPESAVPEVPAQMLESLDIALRDHTSAFASAWGRHCAVLETQMREILQRTIRSLREGWTFEVRIGPIGIRPGKVT